MRRAARRWQLAAWTLLISMSLSRLDAAELEAIPLHFRRAEELIPLLQPLVQPDGIVTGTGDVLLVRASAANLASLRTALAALDRAPKQLLVTVGQGTAAASTDASARGAVVIGTDGAGQHTAGTSPVPANGGTTVQGAVAVNGISQRADIHEVMSVRVLEGNDAQLEIGQSRPMSSTYVVPGRHGYPAVSRTTEYREVISGVIVTPRVSGDIVTLTIAPQQQRLTSERGQDIVHTQGAQTTVSGKLGEWIPIAGVEQSSAGNERGLLTWGTRSANARYDAWVKVELVD